MGHYEILLTASELVEKKVSPEKKKSENVNK